MSALRIVIGGGGTGGHTVPALAMLEALRARVPVDVLWIGSRNGVERRFALQNGLSYRWIPTGKLRRYFTVRTLLDLAAIPAGVIAATALIRAFRPHVVFGTGGYVSVPVVLAGRLNRIPIVIHEQTATAGLATRIAARFADVIAISFESTRPLLGATRATIVHTGLPIREELHQGDAERGRQRFGLTAALPIVYVTGGVLGAQALNRCLAAALPGLVQSVQIVHQCGPAHINGDLPRLLALRETLPPALRARYVVREFLTDELPDIYAAADLVIGRAGASTVGELAALGKPAILIPLPGSRGDEQTANARLLSAVGSAVVVPQADVTPERLSELVTTLVADREALAAMGARGKALAVPDAADRLAALIRAAAESRAVASAPL
ncbi:MAG: undecaprenyldiphospho-muramoylpentapeptide beta-N-acetylglucosaminyltransferase [Thermomicrobium sp.]|nr:undecaprenyldiphospho-muramoylpentapeptide beta-N-acetylglucosaminyltransferase [Thermomicrobium sp.]MDW7981947.1 undecaprenyldiphospho-muramoylpentapeptide beta-N-acetylglucosaminyltransferase [Thermomicrobium sp.]